MRTHEAVLATAAVAAVIVGVVALATLNVIAAIIAALLAFVLCTWAFIASITFLMNNRGQPFTPTKD